MSHSPKLSNLQIALDRLACAEIAQYHCEQERVAAHRDVGRELRLERKSKGVSLRAIAKELGYSAAFISDCELGRRNLSPEAINKYRNFLQYV